MRLSLGLPFSEGNTKGIQSDGTQSGDIEVPVLAWRYSPVAYFPDTISWL
jgi:hypothetical protein